MGGTVARSRAYKHQVQTKFALSHPASSLIRSLSLSTSDEKLPPILLHTGYKRNMLRFAAIALLATQAWSAASALGTST